MADKVDKGQYKNDKKTRIDICQTEIKGIIKQKVKERWQKQQEEERKGRWFYTVQRRVGEMRCRRGNRREETVISRLRLLILLLFPMNFTI